VAEKEFLGPIVKPGAVARARDGVHDGRTTGYGARRARADVPDWVARVEVKDNQARARKWGIVS
jgi:hypothetical protein